jgi:GNAT superfamily N-acetyltransferase
MTTVVVLDQTQPSVSAKVVLVQRAAYRVEADLIGFDTIPPLHETAEDVSKLDLTMLGVLEGRDLVAIAGYRRRGDEVDIDRLAVHPSHFRHGIASLLLEEIHHREREARRFTVSTGARNFPATELYAKLGYRQLPGQRLLPNLLIARFVNP